VPLLVTPSVFNPKLLRTGDFFASMLDSRLIGSDSEVLDMGTGSGVCAVFAAQHARRVVAVDINPAAVRCARINASSKSCGAPDGCAARRFFAPVTANASILFFLIRRSCAACRATTEIMRALGRRGGAIRC